MSVDTVARGLAVKALNSLTSLLVTIIQTLGPASDPITTTSPASSGTFIFGDAIGNVAVTSIALKVNARATGTLTFRRFSGKAIGATQIGADFPVVVTGTGLQVLDITGLGAQKGEYIAFYQSSAIIGYVAAPFTGFGLLYAGSGSLTSFTTTPAANAANASFQVQLIITGQGSSSGTDLTAITAKLTPTNTLYAYGDSMTQGNGGTPYPTQLATLIGRTVNNRGVGAQRAPDIFARWGSYPILVPALTIPTSGSVDFDVPVAFDRANPITAVNSGSTFLGKLAGVAGTLSYVSAGSGLYTYRFTRSASGSAVAVIANEPFQLDLVTEPRDYATLLLWNGRNSIGLQETTGATRDQQFDAVMKWHERAIAFLKTLEKRFIIMGPSNRSDEYAASATTVAGAALNGAQSYQLIVDIENEMRQRWPRNFVNQRGLVVASYNPGDSTDIADHAADRTPTSLRADNLHYNTAGYAVVAQAVSDRLSLLGW